MGGSGISWTVCKSAPRSRRITTPAPHHSVFYRPDALPVSLPQWHTVGSTDVCSVCVWQAVDASGTPLCLHCHTPYQSSLIDKSSVDQNPWLTRLCSRQCMQQFWVVMHVSCSLQSACVKCNLWTFNRLTPGLWKYWNLKPANLRSSKSLNVKVLFESAWKVLECDLLVFFENFDWIMDGYSLELFAMLLWSPVTLLCFSLITYTRAHTRLTALFPGLPGWAGTRKVKPIWILLNQETVSGSGISWAICKSASRCRQITTPAPHHSVFTGLSATQPTASKHWRQIFLDYLLQIKLDSCVNSAVCRLLECLWECAEWVVLERSLKSSGILKLQFSARHVYVRCVWCCRAWRRSTVSVELIDQLSVAVCSAHRDNLRWQECCCQWTSRVEQFTCGTAIKWRHGGDFQKTSEDISV